MDLGKVGCRLDVPGVQNSHAELQYISSLVPADESSKKWCKLVIFWVWCG